MCKYLAMAGSLGLLFGSAPALAQQTPPSDPQISPPAAVGAPIQVDLTWPSAHTETLIGLPIYSSDYQEVGRVSAIYISGDGTVRALEAEVGAFLGIGPSAVRITSDNFAREGDRIVLSLTADEVSGLPATTD